MPAFRGCTDEGVHKLRRKRIRAVQSRRQRRGGDTGHEAGHERALRSANIFLGARLPDRGRPVRRLYPDSWR